MTAPLLMIPGPIELSPGAKRAAAQPPPSHVDPAFIAQFGQALGDLRTVFGASGSAQPFIAPGSGTLAMDIAVGSLVDPGERVLVVSGGVFGDRMAEMARRRGALVAVVVAEPGAVPELHDVAHAINACEPTVIFVTHVDTSTGVRLDVQGIARLAAEVGALVVVDAVCATAAEAMSMSQWGVDWVLTASQKALGAPPGLAVWIASQRAMNKRTMLRVPPPLSLDVAAWLPIMAAYEDGRGSYFATPPTSLVQSLAASLSELCAEGMPAVVARHASAAAGIRRAFGVLGFRPVPVVPGTAANTLSALHLPEGVGPAFVGALGERGVSVAGPLHPALKPRSIRVGHMGWITGQPALLDKVVGAAAATLTALGHPADSQAARAALLRRSTSADTMS